MSELFTKHPYADARNAAFLSLGLWTLGVAIAASGGALARLPATVVAALVLAAVATALAAARLDRRLAAWLGTIDPYTFVAVQAWRLPAGLAFLAAGADGILPIAFARVAGWGDVFVGLAAVAVYVFRAGPRTQLGLHLVGALDLVLAVGTGLAHALPESAAMRPIATWPLAMIPLVGVPVTAAVHAAAIAQLRAAREARIVRPAAPRLAPGTAAR